MPRSTAGSAFADLRRRARLWSATTWIAVTCGVLFVVQLATRNAINDWLAFTSGDAVLGGQVWRFVTFQFLHGGLFHLAFNLFGLMVFGRMIERRLGAARFVALYLLSGIAGAGLFFVLWAIGWLGSAGAATQLVGASGGLFGLIAAAMVLFPSRILNLAFPPIDITVFRLGAVYLTLAAFIVIFHGDARGSNAGGEAAHLGGAIVGFLLAKRPGLLSWADRISPHRLRSPGRRGKAKDVDSPPYMKYHGWR
jgi:membrane associated rhomboid family serine protease